MQVLVGCIGFVSLAMLVYLVVVLFKGDVM